jgi:hypothetical protein
VQAALFAKFPHWPNPVTVVGHVGYLMCHELDNSEPASPVERLPLFGRFTFNAGFASGSFQLTPQQHEAIQGWEQDQRQSEAAFLDIYATAHSWFPRLATYRPGSSIAEIIAAQKQIVDDRAFLASTWDQARPSRFPPSLQVGPGWAVFRWLQVQLLYAIEYIRRYGPERQDIVSRRVPNDVVDSQYLTTALLADGLATADRPLSRMYLQLKPAGQLLSLS